MILRWDCAAEPFSKNWISHGRFGTWEEEEDAAVENNVRNQLLQKLRMIDFSIYETVLFLDAYPTDAEALAYYHKLIEQRDLLMAEYEAKIGPLTIYGNESRDSWDWTGNPWPWEYEAN